ncbi:hypothetical protein QYF61_000638 [Mycteria americana]|uniref:Uncharacterized protein n=1 Tax=Mycteria americana TaxID=33587 RepID=A0AAN7N099_MYCAM|nr:hypothetical protein QYF61_000638 [Mycteria americana]
MRGAEYDRDLGLLVPANAGLSTGCVMVSGYGVTHSVPIFEGYCLPRGVLRLDLDSCDLTELLTRILRESGTSQVATAEELLVQGRKEKLCVPEPRGRDDRES